MDKSQKYKQKYVDYKTLYIKLKYNMIGGKKWELLSEKEKEHIMKNYNTIIKGDKKCDKYPLKIVQNAAKGMYINPENLKRKKQKELCYELEKATKEKNKPFVHEDSITSWANQAAEKYGLEIQDILKMKFGEKLEVILMDRNVGDYMHGTKKGTKYDPKKKGFTYATYIHGSGLTGILDMHGINVFPCFTWEINAKALGGPFWCPLARNTKCNMCAFDCKFTKHKMKDTEKDKEKEKEKDKDKDKDKDCEWNPYKLDPKTKVGWRGPAIRLEDAIKYMPNYVKHYNTWWDDYMPFREDNYLKIKKRDNKKINECNVRKSVYED